ncbi:MAG TPA: adenylate/guanylate cyclase domain-containing protein [Dehalococcoidia bacterium]|nr:adenylate/guanylate cyclase domain-containing protein [Dehalococcoidia bacterium]
MPLGQGQRHTVTVLFADCRGFTRLAQDYPPEEMVKALNRFFQTVTQILISHDGCVDKLLGDGLMAVFGAPLVRPDHADMAVAAALEMQRALTELFPPSSDRPSLQIGIAIHSGEALVGNIGSQYMKDFTAIGEMVNLAAHLQEQAGPGEILLTEATVNMLRTPPKGGDFREVTIKGRAEPLKVRVLASRTKVR